METSVNDDDLFMEMRLQMLLKNTLVTVILKEMQKKKKLDRCRAGMKFSNSLIVFLLWPLKIT